MAQPSHDRLARFEFLGSAQFVHALSTVIVGTAAASFTLERLVGWAGLIGILAALVAFATASAFMRRHALDWQGILPMSLLAYVSWCAVSVLWSEYHWATLTSVLYQLAFTALAVYIALTRDMIQIVRIFGTVLRALLGVSLELEVFSGIIIDTPIRVLGIRGQLADLGPIQGISGDAARFGILAIVAGITFAIEWRTKSVRRAVSLTSLIAAGALVLLTHSNVDMTITGGVIVVAAVLIGIRRVRKELRQAISWIVLAVGVVVAGLGVVFRSTILEAFQGSDQLVNRSALWHEVLTYATATTNLNGFGWIGRWRTTIAPFYLFDVRGPFASAYNALLDVWLQVGVVGLVLFLVLTGLAVTRSWLLAVRQVSIVYLWPALVVLALIASALTESAILVEFCWLTLVICVVKSANKLSWRVAFESINPRVTAPELPDR
ncbi:MAG TPA: hypothetical protein VGC41_03395 [Kofleriaceae bacterium]